MSWGPFQRRSGPHAPPDSDWIIPLEWFDPPPDPERYISRAEARSLWLVGWPALIAATATIIHLIRRS